MGCRTFAVEDTFRFRLGAALSVNEGRNISGWELWEGRVGMESVRERGAGSSDIGGKRGIKDALRYSFPSGLSKA